MDEDRLRSVPLFASLSVRERRRVAQCADEIDVPKGKVLAKEGDLAYEFFVIEEGNAEVTIHGERVDELGPGDFFGEIGLSEEDRRRTATVTATSPMELIVLTGPGFRSLGRELPRVAEQIRMAMAERSER